MEDGKLLLKLDFRNAFNSVRRDKMLEATLAMSPQIYPLVHSVCSQPSYLFYGKTIIESSEGVQQGDPLGPLLFCLAIHNMVSSLKSECRVFYLDDCTLGGTFSEVLEDLKFVEEAAKDLGLRLNHKKSELICKDGTTESAMLGEVPSLRSICPSDTTLLGSPIGDVASIDSILENKIEDLRTLGSNLSILHSHDTLCLLRHAFSLPEVLYILRTAPCFRSDWIAIFDSIQRSLIESICNINLCDQSWLQASLPVNSGGLGIRSAVLLAPSAYLASAAGCSSILKSILPTELSALAVLFHQEALQLWQSSHSESAPEAAHASCQKNWDTAVVEASFQSLLADSDPKASTRLLAAKRKESGAWLTAPPLSSIGLRMDNETIRVAIDLRLGTALCVQHNCQHCGQTVDVSGIHGLSCRQSEGHLPRHSGLVLLLIRLQRQSAACTVNCACPITLSQWRSSPQVFLGRMPLHFSKI